MAAARSILKVYDRQRLAHEELENEEEENTIHVCLLPPNTTDKLQ